MSLTASYSAAYCYTCRTLCVLPASVCVFGTPVNPGKTVEPVDMPFGGTLALAQEIGYYEDAHCATWRKRLNDPCATATQPCAKLL